VYVYNFHVTLSSVNHSSMIVKMKKEYSNLKFFFGIQIYFNLKSGIYDFLLLTRVL